MRALRVREHGTPPVLETEVPVPRPGPGEALIRVAAAALTHLDRSIASGGFAESPPLPYTPCADGAGWVVESGDVPSGTLVWVRGGGVGVHRDGLAADYAAVPAEAMHTVPCLDGRPIVSPLLAGCFFSPTASAYAAVRDVATLRSGERVAVTGSAGVVGSLAVQFAQLAGAEVIAVTSRPERASAIPDGVPVASTLEHPGLDALIDTVGGPDLATRLTWVRPGGRAVLVGYTAGPRLTLDLPAWLFTDVSLLPVNMLRRAAGLVAAADRLLRMYARNELTLPVEPQDLASGTQAWRDLAAGTFAGRVALLPDPAIRDTSPELRAPVAHSEEP
ncbi:MAG: quinone oxidoreductase family protein [bacterium]